MKNLVIQFMTLILLTGIVSAQTTFDRVYNILQTNCTGSCHTAANPDGSLIFDTTKQAILNSLVDIVPVNTVAASRGFMRVYPGDARKSFLFHKVNQGLDVNISLKADEGEAEPRGNAPLSNIEREMIRQWIIFGAADTGYRYADEQVITNYYNGFAEARTIPLPIPDPADGYQIYYGPIFLEPGVEVEFDGVFPLFNSEDIEVYRMHVEMNKESHHMAVFKYNTGIADTIPPGLNKVNDLGDAASLFFSAQVVAQWPNSLDLDLPEGTALLWENNSTLNISYHILNYSDSIIAAEVYFNIYARPQQESTKPMLSYPVRYDGHPVYQGGWDVQNLILYPTNVETTLVINQFSPDSAFYWNLWSIQAHTHELGTDFNVYLRNPDGTKGEIIYNGSYNADHTFDAGRYDWEHPPLRYFHPHDPISSVDMTVGMIHEATFLNDTEDTVGFGLKTTDEMFVTYIFFTKSQTPVGILPGQIFNEAHVKIYPNPVQQTAIIHIGPDVTLNKAEFCIYNLLGIEVMRTSNLHEHKFLIDVEQLPTGTYLYRLVNDGELAASGKVMVQ